MSEGTIVYHSIDFKDCVFIEYNIINKNNAIEITLYLKNNNVKNNYVIGFNTTESYRDTDIKQQLYHNDVVTNHKPYITYHPTISQSIIILIDGTHDMNITNNLCATKILLNTNNVRGTNSIANINIWIHQKHENGKIINLPNITKLNPPIVDSTIKDAYPVFGEDNWWTTFNNTLVDNSSYVIPNNIKWTPHVNFNKSKAKNVANPKIETDHLKQLEHNIKNVRLTQDLDQFGYWLTLNNSGGSARLYITSNTQLYSIIVPEHKTLFKHFIDCCHPVQIHLNDFTGPILIEHATPLLSVDYYENSNGICVTCSNYSNHASTFKIDIYVKNVHVSTRNIIVDANVANQQILLDLTLYNSNKKEEQAIIKTSLIRNNKAHLIGQYMYSYNNSINVIV